MVKTYNGCQPWPLIRISIFSIDNAIQSAIFLHIWISILSAENAFGGPFFPTNWGTLGMG